MYRVQAQREQRGWSRAEVARRAAMREAHYGQIELGRVSVVWPAWRARIAQALGVDEAELFGGDGRPLEVVQNAG